MHLNIMDARAHAAQSSSSPSPGSSPSASDTRRAAPFGSAIFGKEGLFSWRIMGAIFASLLVLGWVFIVIILIQEEKWQLVLVAWLLLYAAAHFCYWYFKRHQLISFQAQICRRVRATQNSSSVRPLEKPADAPPSYDDVIKSEHPPPTYCSLVINTPKGSPKPLHKKKFANIFSFENIPSVFGRDQTPLDRPSTSRKIQPQPPAYSPTISGAISSNIPYRWDPQHPRGSPPPYDLSCTVDIESSAILEGSRPSRTSTSSAQPSRRGSRSVLRSDSQSVCEGTLTPILTPIHTNISNPRGQQLTSTGESVAGTDPTSSRSCLNSAQTSTEIQNHDNKYSEDSGRNSRNILLL